jgi:hypothetical protein
MADYSEAIEKGVSNWLDANRDSVLDIIRKAIADSTESAIDGLTAGAMVAVGKFLDANNADISSGIAAAIALSWQARQHPSPVAHPLKSTSDGNTI